jgi:phosphatidate phosphatase LPIN
MPIYFTLLLSNLGNRVLIWLAVAGTARCTCNIFVWGQQERIVISDIDGTITKSDVRGMLLPMIGESKSTQFRFHKSHQTKIP